jgi:hypothetical protein
VYRVFPLAFREVVRMSPPRDSPPDFPGERGPSLVGAIGSALSLTGAQDIAEKEEIISFVKGPKKIPMIDQLTTDRIDIILSETPEIFVRFSCTSMNQH